MRKRNLSGIYFRAQNEAGDWDNIVFEDLSEAQQTEQLKGRTEAWKDSMIKALAKTLREIGDNFDIITE